MSRSTVSGEVWSAALKDTRLGVQNSVFQKQLFDFRKKILGNPAVKVLFKRALSGRDLADFAEKLLTQKTPVLKSAYVDILIKSFEDLKVSKTQYD